MRLYKIALAIEYVIKFKNDIAKDIIISDIHDHLRETKYDVAESKYSAYFKRIISEIIDESSGEYIVDIALKMLIPSGYGRNITIFDDGAARYSLIGMSDIGFLFNKLRLIKRAGHIYREIQNKVTLTRKYSQMTGLALMTASQLYQMSQTTRHIRQDYDATRFANMMIHLDKHANLGRQFINSIKYPEIYSDIEIFGLNKRLDSATRFYDKGGLEAHEVKFEDIDVKALLAAYAICNDADYIRKRSI